jgi:hypothetical protein
VRKAPVYLELIIRESSTSHHFPTNLVQQITDLFLFTVSISNQNGRDFTVLRNHSKCNITTEQYSKLLQHVAELVEQCVLSEDNNFEWTAFITVYTN